MTTSSFIWTLRWGRPQYRGLCCGILLVMLGIVSHAAFASSVSQCKGAPPSTLPNAVEMALRCNPGIVASSLRYESDRERIELANELPDPVISVGVAPNTFKQQSIDDGYRFSLKQVLPWPGVRDDRKQLSTAKAAEAHQQYRRQQIAVAQQVRVFFYQWHFQGRMLEFLRRKERVLENYLDLVQGHYQAGERTSAAHVLSARQALSVLRLTLSSAKVIRDRAATSLNSWIGLASVPTSYSYTTPADITIPDLTELQLQGAKQAIQAIPALSIAASAKEQAQHNLALAKKARYPTINVNAQYNTLWAMEEKRWMVGIGVNLPLDMGARRVKEQSLKKAISALSWQALDVHNRVSDAMSVAISQWKESSLTVTTYQQEHIPLAEAVLDTLQAEYDAGVSGPESALRAELALLETQVMYQQALLDHGINFANLTAKAGFIRQQSWVALGDPL